MNNKITLRTYYLCFDNKELQEYLLSLKGIKKININDEEFTIWYTKDINPQMIIKEIKLFTNTLNMPSLYYFNKHSEKNSDKYEKYLNNTCCEYCLHGFVESLLSVDGINEVDVTDEQIPKITINYDKDLIDENKLNQMMKKI